MPIRIGMLARTRIIFGFFFASISTIGSSFSEAIFSDSAFDSLEQWREPLIRITNRIDQSVRILRYFLFAYSPLKLALRFWMKAAIPSKKSFD